VLSGISAPQTIRVTRGTKDFWLIVALSRSADETEFRDAATPDQLVKDIRRATRKHHSAEEKIRVVLVDHACSSLAVIVLDHLIAASEPPRIVRGLHQILVALQP
jgi:hypothetical protein